MGALHFPWLMIAILLPLAGALILSRVRNVVQSQQISLQILTATFLCSLAAWLDYAAQSEDVAHDWPDLFSMLSGWHLFAIDELSAPLLALVSLLYLLVSLVTMGSKVRRFSFAANLISLALVLATLSCRVPWGIVLFLVLGTLPPLWELRARRKPTGVYLVHMSAFVLLLVIGWWMIAHDGNLADADQRVHSVYILAPLLLAALIRCGIAPFHCWVSDLFEHATFGTALVTITPMVGVYAVVRLILPTASNDVLHLLGWVSLATAVYAAGMALVQSEARRFFCYVLLSHSALVLVGMQTVKPIGLTAALSLWLSMGLSLAGFGLTLRSLEARHGRLSLVGFHGVYEHTPMLAICFLLTGLASVGFPGTFGFVGTELLVDSVIETYPYFGVAVVVAAALNGIAVVQAYFRLFTGTRHVSSVPLRVTWREQLAMLTLATLILAGGMFPQLTVGSRHRAAQCLRSVRSAESPAEAARGGWSAKETAHIP